MENVTNLASKTYTVLSLILECWIFLIAIGVPTGGIIMVKYLASSFRDITLIRHDDDTLTCSYPSKPVWRQHCFARMIVWIFTPWRKYTKAVENWNKKYNVVNTEISSKVEEILDRDIVTEAECSEFITDKNTIIKTIYDTISKDLTGDLQRSKLKIKQYQEGGYDFRIGGKMMAQSKSYEKLKKLEDLFLFVLEDDEIKESIKNIEIDNNKIYGLKQVFNSKLAWLVYNVRTWNAILSFKTNKYDNNNER